MSKKIPTNNFRRALKPEMGNFVFARNNLFLYQVVYGSAVSAGLVFLLLFSFFVQGVEKVYADQLSPIATAQTVLDEVPEVEVNDLPESLVEPETVANESVNFEESPAVSNEAVSSEDQTEQVNTDASQETTEGEEATVSELPQPEVVDETVGPLEPEDDLDLSNTGGENSSGNESSSETTEVTEDDSVEPNDDTASEDQATSSESEIQSSSAEVDLTENVTFEAVSFTDSDSDFSFNKDECTQLASGSFYCHQPKENTLGDALFSAPDEDGDLEIYLVRGGVQTQVTNNTMDDASPYFDQNTNTIVWHRLIDDRFQVISFDIDSGEETQLTRTAENNMEPNRQGDYTVWQRWVDGGWNIILFDGESEKQITKTTSHNIAPYIHGSLVVWNRYGSANEKTIEMYDIQNESYVSVEDPDGMSVSNPRMVFVYDSLHPNGDIITKGYDVLARKFIDLDTLPRDLPDELPASDSTGETRALIQSKPSLKSDTEESMEGFGSTGTSTLPSVATASTVLTLDLTAAVELEMPVAGNIASSTSTPDLVIEPYTPSVESSIETVQE